MRDVPLTVTNFIHDAVYRIRERGADAERQFRETQSPFDAGRAMAFREALAMLQNDATTLDVPLDGVCLDGFDPIIDPLDPPLPSGGRT